MTTYRLRINDSDFVAVQRNRIVALVPDGRVEEASAALAAAGVDLAHVDVLQGEAGARILDIDGTEHGFLAHVVRSMQKLGSASNERENFALALSRGQSVFIVPVAGDDDVHRYARTLMEHGGRRLVHFGAWTADPLTY